MRVEMRLSASSLGPGKSSRLGRSHIWLLFLFIPGVYSVLCLCNARVQAQNAVVLVGSGSSVPAPLYNRWAKEFAQHNQNVQIKYVPIGTSEGIKQISHGAGDFAAGESLLTSTERTEGNLIALPAVLI